MPEGTTRNARSTDSPAIKARTQYNTILFALQ
nr:MAG TPA: hypothetical protein [Caudoviricetes sp.]